MSEEESFLERWARRKRDAANTAVPDSKSVPDNPPPTEDGTTRAQPASARDDRAPAGDGKSSLPTFDLAKLPSLDSITAETDIRAFLLPGVPAELSRAALRRAWSADPAIRDFVGLADYDWDFNTEGAITGFGPLEMTEELRRRVSDMVGRSLAPDEPESSEPVAARGQTTADAREKSDDAAAPAVPALGSDQPDAEISNAESSLEQSPSRNCEEFKSSGSVHIASQHCSEDSANDPDVVPRRHGRALPT